MGYIDALASIIEYESNANQSFAIFEKIYSNKGQLDEIMTFAKELKLRHGYDKLLLSVHRFYEKESIKIESKKPYSSMIALNEKINESVNINKNVLGINDLKFEVSITVKKNDDNDDDNNKEEVKKDGDDEDEDEIPEAVECQIWLKIPVDINRKQIDIWNDILLKTVAIELDLTKEEIDSDDLEKVYKETISLSLEENFVGLIVEPFLVFFR